MRKAFQKIASVAAAFLMVVVYAMPAHAQLLQNAKVTLSDPVASAASGYTFSFNNASTNVVGGIRLAWRTTASSGEQRPTSSDLTGAPAAPTGVSGPMTNGGGTAWTIDQTDANTGVLYLDPDVEVALSGGTNVFTITGIDNPSIAAPPVGCTPTANGAAANVSGTCYVRIQTFPAGATAASMAAGTGLMDEVTVAFTVTSDVSVTAKVDPSLTFTVDGVASGQAANAQTTSATSTYSTLPFGYMQTNVPKYLAHDLKVRTNANNGYTVTLKARGSEIMTGTYANNIDPFTGNSATGGDPKAWVAPTGNAANTNSGWIGWNTTDTDVAGWATPSGLWGPVQTTDNQIMRSTTPDLGSVATRITFALEVNVYQPSDSYSGTFVYNCVPTY